MTFQPTSEQQDAIALFRSGANMAIEAGAGTGKTSTLALLAQASGGRKGQYIAFNKAIVTEAGERFPGSVNCATAHSLAFRAVGRGYAHRLKTPRMKSMDIARLLRIDPLVIRYGSQSKPMAAGYLAGLVMRSVVKFCQTADPEPTERHVPYIDGIDVPAADGRRTYGSNDVVRAHVLPAVRRAWADLCDRNGQLPYRHDHYLKLHQLSDPYIDADYILFDECQDASPVLLDIVLRQTHAQLVFVGDGQQAIYGFTGAVNALDRIRDTGASTCFLTRSFRFGPAIADVANNLLERLDAELRLTGSPDVASVVAAVPEPDCILTRTNAVSVQTVLEQLAAGRKVALVGGGREVLDFARAADDLKNGRWTSHPELACFQTWGEVQEYCLVPGTRILTADLRWQPIELLAVGDALVGFDEENESGNGGRRFRTVTVEASQSLVQPCRCITLGDGRTVTASDDHRWLVKSGHQLRWKRTRSLRPGDPVVSVGPAWDADTSREAGWLAGIFDGEGCVSGRTAGSRGRAVSVAQREGVVLDQIRSLLKERGVPFGDYSNGDVRQLSLSGSLAGKLRFLGTVRPERLVAQAHKLWEDRRVERLLVDTVVAVEPVGDLEVVAVQTSGRTLIAEGLLSHNCEQDAQGGELRLLVNLVDEFGVEKIVAALGHNCVESDADVVVSTAHKAKGREWGSVQIAGDFKAPKDGGELDDEELRLLYVACTRARRELDVTLVPHATESPEEDIDDVPLPGFAVADDLSALEMTARYGTRQAPPA